MDFMIRIALSVILIPAISHGGDQPHHDGNQNIMGVEALSDGLRELLSREMYALQGGMKSIIPAYNSGDWGEIEIIARKMKDSYILKQSLTESQVSELHSLLPPAFIKEDQRFHYLAGMLEHVAKNKKVELINFYFSEMNESCVNCHTLYATHKFPALSPGGKEGEHEH
jgi:hypothetical protein